MFSGGTGKCRDPYLISTVSDLLNLQTLYDEDIYPAFAKITNDIDMTGVVFNSISAFGLSLDGGGHQIKGISGEFSKDGFSGLFGRFWDGEVKNLKIKDVTLGAGRGGSIVDLSAFCGSMYDSKMINVHAENVIFEKPSHKSTLFLNGLAGGGGEYDLCSLSNVTIDFAGSEHGDVHFYGLFGIVDSVKRSELRGLRVTAQGADLKGIIVGYSKKSDRVFASDCTVSHIGGGEVLNVKGLHSPLSINCGVQADVYFENVHRLSSLAGFAADGSGFEPGSMGSYENCYTAISFRTDVEFKGTQKALLATPPYNLTSCYGDMGLAEISGKIEFSEDNSLDIRGATSTAAMKNRSTYMGWDFDNIWQMGPSGYPELRPFDPYVPEWECPQDIKMQAIPWPLPIQKMKGATK